MQRAVTILSVIALIAVLSAAVGLWGTPEAQQRQFHSCLAEVGAANIANCMASHGYDYYIWSLSCLLPRGKFEHKAACYSSRDVSQPRPF